MVEDFNFQSQKNLDDLSHLGLLKGLVNYLTTSNQLLTFPNLKYLELHQRLDFQPTRTLGPGGLEPESVLSGSRLVQKPYLTRISQRENKL